MCTSFCNIFDQRAKQTIESVGLTDRPDTVRHFRVVSWANGQACGSARHDPLHISCCAGPKLNGSGLFVLVPDRVKRSGWATLLGLPMSRLLALNFDIRFKFQCKVGENKNFGQPQLNILKFSFVLEPKITWFGSPSKLIGNEMGLCVFTFASMSDYDFILRFSALLFYPYNFETKTNFTFSRIKS